MAPELVKEFISAFHLEANRQNSNHDLARSGHQADLVRVTKKLKGYYDAIADGLRTAGLKAELEGLEARQLELREQIDAAPIAQPRFHPRLADVYRQNVADLHDALSDPDARTEASEILRGLIERVTIKPDGDGFIIELTGKILELLALPGSKVPDSFASSVKVVAGARKLHKLLFSVTGLSPTSPHALPA